MSSDAHLNNVLRKIAEEQNYKNFEIKVSPVSTGGANYSSLLYTAQISGQGKEDLHLFIKVLAIGNSMREELLTTDNVSQSVTEREKAFYTVLKKAYENIENKYQVPEEHRLQLPKYYGSEVNSSIEVLVIENLVVKGFESFDRFKSMDWEYARKAVMELAKIHALSVAMQINYPEEFKNITDRFTGDLITEHLFQLLWAPGVQNALNVLKGDNKNKFQKFSDKLTFAKMNEYKKPQKLMVIAHGDYRPSNFMHRVLEDDSLQVMALDHQTMYLGSPIPDLLGLIGIATDRPFREQYYEKLIDLYYTQLSGAFRRMDIDPEKTYSREDFYDEVKEKVLFGLASATFGLPFITVESEKAPELKAEMSLDSLQITEVGPLYTGRIRDIVSDYVRWGVLTD